MLESTDAASPFNHPKADIILRSSDNIDFRIFKLFLSLASPFFESLFELPQPDDTGDQETKDGLIVIPVTENSTTLDTLLRFCYPCTLAEDPCLDQFDVIVDVLEAAQKYSLHAIERKVTQAICTPKVLEAEPLRCFAIARRGKLENEAVLAAKYTLRQPLIPAWFKEIELITATDLLQLLTYHQKCGNAVQELKRDTSWIVAHYGSSNAWLSDSASSGCACPRPTTQWGPRLPPHWWTDFLAETFSALQAKPCGATVDFVAALTVRKVRQSNCTACSPKVAEGMREFSALLTKHVEQVVSKAGVVDASQPYDRAKQLAGPAIRDPRDDSTRCVTGRDGIINHRGKR